MSGMGSTLQLTNSTVVAAFRSALLHQGIVALLIFPAGSAFGNGCRPRAATRPVAGPLAAEPKGRRVIRIGFGVLWIIDGLLQAQRPCRLAWPGAAWRALPALPAGTSALPAGAATPAAAPSGGFQALTARGGRLSVWALGAGTGTWSRSQAISVAIPDGSSG
jgi:hypothetical protein